MATADLLQELASDISDCYDEVQTKGGTISQNKTTNNLATAIGSIPSGTTPTGTLSITQNGTYDVTDYESASVAVPIGLRIATGTFTPTENSFSVIVDWNLDFVPVVAFCKIADGSEPDTMGIDGAFSIKGGSFLPIDGHFLVENSVDRYSLQPVGQETDPLLSQTQWKMTYRSARYSWRKGVTYRWYAIEGAEE